jgi:large subunit ribosomal protein L23
MAILDIFKGKQEKERFEKKRSTKTDSESKVEQKEASKKAPLSDKKTDKKTEEKKSEILISPRVTEKSTMVGEQNVYTFEIHRKANKIEVKREIKKLFKVDPVKVNVVNIPDKKVFMRGKYGSKKGYRKAMVYLKKGDKINEA